MFLKTEIESTEYVLVSKLGKEHRYKRKKTLAVFRCDNCDQIFKRELKKIHSKRLSNNYFHCCNNCDSKRFAQKKGVERRFIWDLPASSTLPINRF